MTDQQALSVPGAPNARTSALRAVVVVVVGALLIGGATSLAQQLLPHWAASSANSSGSWTIVTFALLWWSRARLVLSAVLGIVGFVLLLQGYAVVSTWRGFPYHAGLGNAFTIIAILAGPFLGLAAHLAREASIPALRAVAGAVPAAVLVGEGAYGLTVIADTTSPVYWTLQIIVGVGLAVGLASRGHSVRVSLAWAVVAMIAGAAAFYALYAFVL